MISVYDNVYLIPHFKNCILLNSNKNIIYPEKNKNILENEKIQNILKNKNIININDKCIYLGFLTKHYGHFIIESLSRFWIFLKNNSIENINDYKYIFTKGPIVSDSIDVLNNETF